MKLVVGLIVSLGLLEGNFIAFDVCQRESVGVGLEMLVSAPRLAEGLGRDSIEEPTG